MQEMGSGAAGIATAGSINNAFAERHKAKQAQKARETDEAAKAERDKVGGGESAADMSGKQDSAPPVNDGNSK